jgi:hypothetical protein
MLPCKSLRGFFFEIEDYRHERYNLAVVVPFVDNKEMMEMK